MTDISQAGAAHDVLAADEFAMPAPGEFQHTGPVELPDDPTGETRPHDVLAAEEFAMPAPSATPFGMARSGRGGVLRVGLLAAGVLVLVLVLRRRRA